MRTLALTAGVLAFLSIGFFAFAWSDPAVAPPAGNTPAPLNIGSTAQTKNGGLNILDKVGIGVTVPTAKLHVIGANGEPALRLDGSSLTAAETVVAEGKYPAFFKQTIAEGYGVTVWRQVDSGSATDGSNGLLRVIDDNATNTAPAFYVRQSGMGDILRLNQATTTALVVKNGGSVGVGTATPQSALQVVGYTQLDLTSGAPLGGDCDEAAERGRMKVDSAAGLLYICVDAGWVSK